MKETITLNTQEQKRVMVLNRLLVGQLTAAEAAVLLKLSERQVRRLSAAYQQEGAAALAHGNRGRKPVQSISEEVRSQVIELASTTYVGCNYQHLRDLLAERDGIELSRTSVRRILLAAGIASPRKQRRRQHRRRRVRDTQEGMLVQIDGSRHAWLGDRGHWLCLLAAIDDATGTLAAAVFREEEDAAGYFLLVQQLLEQHGRPLALYHDRHGIFQQNSAATEADSLEEQLAGKQDPTQFGRLLEELEITSIAARSPQAKGRVERLFGTLQKRLVMQLRLSRARTLEQAKQFGIATCIANPDLPEDFLNGKKILVTSVQKLFNGLTKFGLHRKSIQVGTILMDDAHACSDTIREACRLRITKDDPAYNALKTLFAAEVEQQGVGSYADIVNNKYDAFLPVPYRAWMEHESEVARILSDGSTKTAIKFAWPILKDILGHCQCMLSGEAVEIEPYIPPLNAFGTYWDAQHRIFMSATVTDDAFLVKGIQLSPETIKNPLTYEKERWSGEKMILIPSLIHEELDRAKVVSLFGRADPERKYGVVALVPSFNGTKDWEKYGAIIAKTDTVGQVLEVLQDGNFESAVVLVNRYDGIDLPDDSCRILILDTIPYSESLIDLYQEACRPDSEATFVRIVRTIEQGLGRSVRGEKDYPVIVITGTDLTRLLHNKSSRKYLSSQMSTQIEIGIEIAEMVRQDIKAEETPEEALHGLINQCLNRDPDWKAFYAQQMETVKPSGANERVLQLYAAELAAEQKYLLGDYESAVSKVQSLLDDGLANAADRGWYLQEMARYNYRSRRPESQKLQISAYNSNHLLLRPPVGVTVAKITTVSQGRMERIIAWIGQYTSYQELDIALSPMLGQLVFGTKADKFEGALDELSRALGFVGERPDKMWKEGPDNLWALDDTQYILRECKSEVDVSRAEITKREAEQMNRSYAWFGKYYAGSSVKNIIVHPSDYLSSAAAFINNVEVMRVQELKRLMQTVRDFYKSFETLNFHDLSPIYIQKLVDAHNLSISAVLSKYTRRVRTMG